MAFRFRPVKWPLRPMKPWRPHRNLVAPIWVVKAQVHAGGRGKAGGVKVARDFDTVYAAANGMLGQHLVTKQTGPEGLPISQVYVETGSDIEREIYLSLTLNREKSRIAVVASSAGGMDIEEVAAKEPEKILSVTIHPAVGLEAYQARELAFGLGFSGAQITEFTAILKALYKLYIEQDASLVEVNPLIVTKAGKLLALDAKIGIDPNALYRHPELVALRDKTQEDPIEARAAEHDLNYVSLDGDIACMVNGAGLAMATMDIIKLHGAKPANFLDVGGGATAERVTAAFELILANPKVRAILVNIFGGIVPLRRDRRGHHRRGEEGRCEGAGGGAPRRHQRQAGARDARQQRPRRHARRRAHRCGEESRGRRPQVNGYLPNEHSRQQAQPRDRAGLHRQAGHLPRAAVHRLRHPGRRWRHAGSRRHRAPRPAGVRYRAPGGREDFRHGEHDLCAGGLRRRCHPRSGPMPASSSWCASPKASR